MVKAFILDLRHSRIFKAYSTSVLGVISGLLTQFVFIRGLTRVVSSTDFSLYAFVFQTVSYLTVFQLGMDFCISREVAISLSLNNYDLASYSYSFIKRFNRAGSIVASLCILLLTVLALSGFILPADYKVQTGALLILLFGLFQILNFFLRPSTAVLIGSNYQNVVNINGVIINIASTLLAYTLLKAGFGLFSMPLALVLWSFLNLFFLKGLVKSRCPWLTDSKQTPRRDLDRSFFRYGLKSALGGIAWTIEATADVIILNSIGFMNLVGVYVIWWRFPQMLFDLTTRLTTSSYPSIAQATNSSDKRDVRLLTKLLLIISGIGFTVAIGIILWLPSLVNIWVGQKYYYDRFEVLSILIALVIFLRVIGNCLGMFLVAIGEVNITASLSWIQAILKIVLGIFLAKKYQLEGLVLASIVCSLVQVVILGAYLMSKRFLSLKLSSFVFITFGLVIATSFIKIGFNISAAEFIFGVSVTGISSLAIWIGLSTLFGYGRLFFSRAYAHGRPN